MSDTPTPPESSSEDRSSNEEQSIPSSENQQIRLQLDESQVDASYANLCFVSSTPEEVILDFALNKNPLNRAGDYNIRISQRLVLTPYTAKRLASLLSSTIQRHEQHFGPLVDFRNRVVQSPQPTSEPSVDES